MMSSKFIIGVLSYLRSRNKIRILANVVSSPDADKLTLDEIVIILVRKSYSVQQRRNIVGIATDNLYKLILIRNQRLVIYSPRIWLSEPELTALSYETLCVMSKFTVVIQFVFMPYTSRRTIDHDCSVINRFYRFVRRIYP